MRTLTPEHKAAMVAGKKAAKGNQSPAPAGCLNTTAERRRGEWRYRCTLDPAGEWYESPCESTLRCRYLNTGDDNP